MQRTAAKIFGFLVLGLGVVGLAAGEKQLLEFMNIDIALDLARLGLAALLLYAAYIAHDMAVVRTALTVLGVMYVGLAVIGLFSSGVGGVLPHKLSAFDKVFHLVSGVFALAVAAKKDDQGQPSHAAV